MVFDDRDRARQPGSGARGGPLPVCLGVGKIGGRRRHGQLDVFGEGYHKICRVMSTKDSGNTAEYKELKAPKEGKVYDVGGIEQVFKLVE
jgi:hypothetical protein